MSATHWHRLLDEARTFPPDQEIWAELDDFVDSLRQIRADKLAEATRIQLSCKIDAALKWIVEEHSALLRFLGLSVPPISLGVGSIELERLYEHVEEFGGLLAALSDLRCRPCETFTEEERRADEIRAIRAEAKRRLAVLEVIQPLAGHLATYPSNSSETSRPAENARLDPEEGSMEGALAMDTLVGAAYGSSDEVPAVQEPSEGAPSDVPGETSELGRLAGEIEEASLGKIETTGTDAVGTEGMDEVETEGVDEVGTEGVDEGEIESKDGGEIEARDEVETKDGGEAEVKDGGEVEAKDGGEVQVEAAVADEGETKVGAALAEEGEPPSGPTAVDASPSFAPSKINAWREFDEQVLGERCAVFLDSSAPELGSVLVELQRRWLRRGQLLRGYLAARHLEELASVGESPMIPAWLCWLASLLFDPGALRIDFQVQEFTLQLHGLSAAPQSASVQRFLFCWLGVALLGPQPQRAVQIAFHLKPSLWEAEWAHDELFYFCRRCLIEPARQGRQPRFRLHGAPDELWKQIRERAGKAGEIMSLNNNYRNALVKRYWFHLVGKGGPVERLIDGARQGTLPDPLPTVADLTNSHDDWTRIEADYRRNMERRLGNFLDVLREALVLHQQLRAQQVALEQQTLLSQTETEQALSNAPALIAQIEREGCPSLAGLQHLVKRLHDTREQHA